MAHLPLPLHNALREAVAARFGQPLRYPSHCDALEAELQKTATNGGRRLSPSTLRRFFGLVEKEGGYHLHTLDTLARYAGHPDFASFGQTVAGLAAASTPAAPVLTDIPELLAMDRLAYPKRLLLGYFLGRITRPVHPGHPAVPLALRLAAHPAGQEFFVESFVDVAHLNGAYGEVVQEYLKHKPAPEAQLFGHCALFMGEFLAENEVEWRARLAHLLSLPVPPETHAFPRGRRAFAKIVAAWYDSPTRTVPATLMPPFYREAHAAPRPPSPQPQLPAFYNQFPAGYHFFVAEALFLTSQFELLQEWLEFTWVEFPELVDLGPNVFHDLLRDFHSVAQLRTGRLSAAQLRTPALFGLETHSWLLDYYKVHLWLVELHFAASHDAAQAQRLQQQVEEFGTLHRMPFFTRVAQQIITTSASGSAPLRA